MKKIEFKLLKQSDLDLLCQWFQKPHVLEWWQDRLSTEEIKLKYGSKIHDAVVRPLIIYCDDRPIGFIQYYWASKVGEGWWENENEGTVGTDQFIGEEEYINKGYGTLIMQAFVQYLFQDPKIIKIITEADHNNIRAQRCYLKAGFKKVGLIDTPDGQSVLFEVYKNLNKS